MRLINVIASSVMFMSFAQACGDSHWGGDKNIETRKSDSSFSYKFSSSYWPYGGSCTTEQRFSSKEEFCRGLTKRKLNDNCALESRRKSFIDNGCGTFEETDFSMFLESYTPRDRETGKACDMKYDGPNPLPTRGDYCAALKSLFAQFKCDRVVFNELFQKDCTGTLE